MCDVRVHREVAAVGEDAAQSDDPEELDEPRRPSARKLQGPLLTEPISSMGLGPPITVPVTATLQQAVEIMQSRHLGCVLVVRS